MKSGFIKAAMILFVLITFGLVGYLYSANAILKKENEGLQKSHSEASISSPDEVNPFVDGKKYFGQFSSMDDCEQKVSELEDRIIQLESDNIIKSSQNLNNSFDLSDCEREKRRLESVVNDLEYEIDRLRSELNSR